MTQELVFGTLFLGMASLLWVTVSVLWSDDVHTDRPEATGEAGADRSDDHHRPGHEARSQP